MAIVSVFAELYFRIVYRNLTFPLEIVMHEDCNPR